MAENVFDQLKAICSTSSEYNLEDTPLLTTIDPFLEYSNQNILIYKTKLLTLNTSNLTTLTTSNNNNNNNNNNNSLQSYNNNENYLYIRRVYIKSNEFLDYRYIGWILNEDIIICMICSNEFTFLNRRHHCRICGDIICDNCSQNMIYITEIYNYGPVKVCNCCYYGQAEMSLKDMISSIEYNNSIQNNSNNNNHNYNNNTNNNIRDDESIVSRSDLPSLSTLIGLPCLVIKCRQTNQEKVFINICYHSLITTKNIILIGENCPRNILGKGGESCFVYDVCVSLESLEQEDDELLDKLFLRIISVLNRRRHALLESSYIILRTKKNFKGDHIPLFLFRLPNGQIIHEHTIVHLSSPIAEYADNDLWEINRNQQKQQQLQQQIENFQELSTEFSHETQQPHSNNQIQNENENDQINHKNTNLIEDSIQENNLNDQSSSISLASYQMNYYQFECPNLFSGWMKRNEGTIINSFVKRYFVLDKCILTCYEMSSDTPPYGRNQKGQFQLTSSTQIDLISNNTPTSKFNLLKNKTNIFNKIDSSNKKKYSLTQTQILLTDPFRKFQKNKFTSNNNTNDIEEYFLEVDNVEDHTRWVQSLLLHIEYCTMTKRRNSLS